MATQLDPNNPFFGIPAEISKDYTTQQATDYWKNNTTVLTSPDQTANFDISGQATIPGTNVNYLYGTPKSIAADTINTGESLLQPPSTSITSNTADSTAAGAAATVQDYNNQQVQEAEAAANKSQTDVSAVEAELNKLMAADSGQIQELSNQEAAQNVPGLKSQIGAITSQVNAKLAEYQALQASYANAEATLQSDASSFRGQGRGISLSLVRGQEAKTKAQVQYEKVGTLNTKAAEISLLQAQGQALSGQLELAQETAQKAVDLKYEAIEDQIKVKQQQLEFLYKDLDRKDKVKADALQRQYEDQKAKIAEEKATAKANVTEALSQGITTRYVNRNGKFYRTMDGHEFNSEAEFYKDAGVKTFADAYKRGLVSDLTGDTMTNRDFVSQLRAKYWDAGVSLADTPDSAMLKVRNNSEVFKKESYIKPEDTGSNGLTPAQINTTVNQIAGAFDNEPIVKNYNTAQEGYQTLQKIGVKTSSPADDIAFIYAFAKIMDPNSVVREGEYNTIQRYAQTWADTFGFTAKRLFSNTNFLSSDAKQKMLNALTPKVQTLTDQYNKTKSEYQRQMDDARAGLPRTITDYSVDSVTDPKVEQMRKDGLSDQDIEQILGRPISFKGVGGDTNKATNLKTVSVGNKKITVSSSIINKLLAANKEFFAKTGRNLMINQSHRTTQQQAELYKKLSAKGARVAPPGKSFHEKGLAIDVTNWQEAQNILRKYGFKNNLADDRGHFSVGEFS